MSLVVVGIVDRLLLELDQARDEPLDAIRSMDYAIRFVQGCEVAFYFVAHGAWSVLLLEVTLVTRRWTCFFGLDERIEVRLDEEGGPGAIAQIGEGEVTPLPRLGHQEDLTTALNPSTIALVEVIHVFAFEVSKTRLPPMKSLYLCSFYVGHEREEVFDPCVVSVVVVSISGTSLPVEKINCVGVEFVGDVDRCACLPFVVLEGGELDSGLDFVLDGGDVIMGDGVVDLLKPLFCEEAVVPDGMMRIFRPRKEGRQHRRSKAAVVAVLDIDDCMLLGEECWELPEVEARESDIFHHVEICLDDLIQNQT